MGFMQLKDVPAGTELLVSLSLGLCIFLALVLEGISSCTLLTIGFIVKMQHHMLLSEVT